MYIILYYCSSLRTRGLYEYIGSEFFHRCKTPRPPRRSSPSARGRVSGNEPKTTTTQRLMYTSHPQRLCSVYMFTKWLFAHAHTLTVARTHTHTGEHRHTHTGNVVDPEGGAGASALKKKKNKYSRCIYRLNYRRADSIRIPRVSTRID